MAFIFRLPVTDLGEMRAETQLSKEIRGDWRLRGDVDANVESRRCRRSAICRVATSNAPADASPDVVVDGPTGGLLPRPCPSAALRRHTPHDYASSSAGAAALPRPLRHARPHQATIRPAAAAQEDADDADDNADDDADGDAEDDVDEGRGVGERSLHGGYQTSVGRMAQKSQASSLRHGG